ncbi:MAG: DUF1232 domain-containing protein [Polyangiaceae bacterium]|nr:DUF1232 domain-containing protein [Polyangiaceae bacterium]
MWESASAEAVRVSHPSPPHPHSRGSRAPSALRPGRISSGRRRLTPEGASTLGAAFRFLVNPAEATVAKLLVLAAVVYLVFPIDLVPDVIPILGWLDDLGAVALASSYLVGRLRTYLAERQAPAVIETEGQVVDAALDRR